MGYSFSKNRAIFLIKQEIRYRTCVNTKCKTFKRNYNFYIIKSVKLSFYDFNDLHDSN